MLQALQSCHYFKGSTDHSFDSMEPFSLSPEKQSSAIQAQVGKAQDSQNFQDVPLIAHLSEVVAAFGMYFKYVVLSDFEQPATSSVVAVPRPARNALRSVAMTIHQ